jgi:hypothetical protein
MRRVCSIAVAAALVLLVAAPATAGAAVQVNRSEVAGESYNACTDELMYLSGWVQWHSETFTDEAGGFHVVYDMGGHLTGVGLTSGFTFTSTNQQSGQAAFNSANSGSQTLIATSVTVGRGAAPNLLTHTTSLMTLVNGNVIIQVSDITFECM